MRTTTVIAASILAFACSIAVAEVLCSIGYFALGLLCFLVVPYLAAIMAMPLMARLVSARAHVRPEAA